MRVLLISTYFDEPYFERFQRLPALRGCKLLNTSKAVGNSRELDAICKRLQIDAVCTTRVELLHSLLAATPDFIPSPRKKPSLDNYAGSLLHTASGIPVVILNPLERLQTVAYEKAIVDRYLSKITKANSWFKQTKFQWKLVTADNQYQILEEISRARLVAVDIETPWPADAIRSIRCASYTCYHPATHTTNSYVVPFTETWHQEFIRAANSSATPKVFQNGLFDNVYFLRWGAPCRNWFYDTFHLFHSWYSELPKRLDFVASFAIRDVRYWKEDGKTGNLEDLYRYNALDGWSTVNALLSLLQEAPDWAIDNYCDHEFPMVFPCITSALEGLVADKERFQQIKEKKEIEVEKLLKRLQVMVAADSFNPGSPKQMSNLFQLLGCSDLVKQEHLSNQENARRGTGKIPAQKAKYRHPLNHVILTLCENYKQERKQVGTYFDVSKLWNGLILWSINPGKTDTGRGASEESAFDCGWQIQNIPRDDLSFKECCLAPPGWFIAEIDKKQSEARCVGYLAGEQKLIDLVESSHDYHSWNASEFFGVPYENIYDEAAGKTLDKPLRDLSKRTNHGANYNMGAEVMLDTMGPAKVAAAKVTLNLPSWMRLRDVCQYLLDRYAKSYPNVKGRWYQSIISRIEVSRKLVSPLGWTRYFFGDPKRNKQHLNAAVAHEPQNLSVAIINKEWYKIWRETIYGSLVGRIRIKAQIHDSLLFIYKTPEDAKQVEALMNVKVPVTGADGQQRVLFIPCDLSLGSQPTRRWSDLK